jgi:hypothetical protein
VKDQEKATPGVRVATTIPALVFASSTSTFTDDQAEGSPVNGQVATLSPSVAQALALRDNALPTAGMATQVRAEQRLKAGGKLQRRGACRHAF